jgi:hypothetical protein
MFRELGLAFGATYLIFQVIKNPFNLRHFKRLF